MTKSDIIKCVSKQTGVDRETVTSVIESYVNTVKSTLIEGESINFRNFGTFYLKRRAPKTGRNLMTNTTILIPAHKVALFKPSKEFADAIASATTEE